MKRLFATMKRLFATRTVITIGGSSVKMPGSECTYPSMEEIPVWRDELRYRSSGWRYQLRQFGVFGWLTRTLRKRVVQLRPQKTETSEYW